MSSKNKIKEKTIMINAKWSFENLPDLSAIDKKPVSEMTEEEREDEVINRLKYLPVSNSDTLETTLCKILADEIAREIDLEMLNGLYSSTKGMKGLK